MNYREFDPNHSCLPPEAYPVLWASAARTVNREPVSWFRRFVQRVVALLPALFLAAALPVETAGDVEARQESLVYRQPKQGAPKPQPLPRIAL